ncbi:MAG: ATP-binding cassette domain-containing protein [Myxococcales bacterium]|nr:ATP-binding cassette domain-containing protein [Myxococcales bacterium]
MPSLLHVRGLDLDAPGGRPLVRGLDLELGSGERVAVIGRNGVGKSSLLQVLAGEAETDGGFVRCHGTRHFVPQRLAPSTSPSPAGAYSAGELRRRHLERAFDSHADLLLLDEPSDDLDAEGIDWLVVALERWPSALVVVSHDRRLLSGFDNYFVVSEGGCHHVQGDLASLMSELERRENLSQQRYARTLLQLESRERHDARVRRRRQRKKNLGRLHELGRCPSRARLNENRSYAQESQGKRAVLQRTRIEAARSWARASRRTLAVELALSLELPEPPTHAPAAAELDAVGADIDGRCLFDGISLRLGHERLAITGPNGAGKSTLLQILTGNQRPSRGRVRCEPLRIGYVAQNASNFCLKESLLDQLLDTGRDTGDAPRFDDAARQLQAHRFPLALAERPLYSLSPGERLRAALIALSRREPAPDVWVLDEPTGHLDLLGLQALEAVLAAWRGGLVVVSHDAHFLEAIGVDRRIELGAGR